MDEISAIPVGKWSIAFHHPTHSTLVMLEWKDREPLNLALPPEQAVALAETILENYKATPPTKRQMS
jgi:hypothetical protein